MSPPAEPAILRLLKQYGIRQQDLVEKFNVSRAVVSRWAHGTKPIPDYRLRDLWALAYLARAHESRTGGAGRDVLPMWTPTRLEWQTNAGREAFTRTWDLPASDAQAMETWGRATFQQVLLQPGGAETIHLHDATVNLQPYVDRVVAAARAGTPPDAFDLETLRHMTEMATVAIAQLQETWAKQPLPHAKEQPHVDEADQRRAVQRTDSRYRVH